MPSDEGEFNDRVLVGGISSANIFGSVGHDFSSSVGVRGGAQFTPQLWSAMNLPVETHNPIGTGGSLVFRPGKEIDVSLGAEAQFDLYPRNIQNPMSWQPNYAGTAPFVAVASPIVDFESSVLMTGTGKEFRAEAGFPFSFGNDHRFLASLEGFMTLDGSPVYPMGGFLNITYSPAIGEEQGIVVSANIQTAGRWKNYLVRRSSEPSERYPNPSDRFQEIAGNIITFDQEMGASGNIEYTCSDNQCSRTILREGQALEVTLDCQSEDGIIYECSDQTTGARLERTFRREGAGGESTLVEQRLVILEPFMRALWNSESLSEFANQTRFHANDKNIGSPEGLDFLHYLARMAYETYDEKGLTTFSGSGGVNSISIEDIYKKVRTKVMDPYNQDETTVCRGISRLITAVAHGWGWEGYSAALSTGDMGHVVSVVRPNDISEYQIVNQGIPHGGAGTILETLENFALAQGYPPQLQYTLYDHEGNYVRAVNTNLGNQLFSRTVAPDRLKSYLRGGK